MNEIGIVEDFDQKQEVQNNEYEGLILKINNRTYRSRLAKLTPKKKGYFVAFWEKNADGVNQAFSYEQTPEKVMITIIDQTLRGQFIFPKDVLLTFGVLKSSEQKGKMAMRVYPSWVTGLNTNARKTQTWQEDFFIDLTDGLDGEKLKKLYF
ncbi:MepB family protein [Alkalicoccobacillus murimartini]|uniref:MepB protein n=1 Tax=Alkalicoccobacillus murimartini TaxID=171685 RepID=A0ABT9YII5_9BACI|nr:MepB family protein [Alkalicoccobacillus murimartini]MDQ0207664.1 hypothetical protein [Alkalicoccobacillus murimartini]